jgi:tripartite-type tricarboxylate transporter receptor subunit TctC
LETSGWQGIVGPAGMPKDVVNRISKALHDTLAKPDVRQKFAANGSTIMERGPDEFTAFHTAEINRWVPVIKASGATLE